MSATSGEIHYRSEIWWENPIPVLVSHHLHAKFVAGEHKTQHANFFFCTVNASYLQSHLGYAEDVRQLLLPSIVRIIRF